MTHGSRSEPALSRRDAAKLTIGAAIALLAPRATAQPARSPIITRAIPSSGEAVPVVGLGTGRVFDNADEQTTRAAQNVVEALVAGGGRLIDTASTYGDAEKVIGSVTRSAQLRDKVFIATKLEAPDPAELRRSLTRLLAERVDLLQLHNVRNPRQSLAKFHDWKAQGICRYTGITCTDHRDFPAVEFVLRREKPDFVQIDYAIDDRAAERRILPLAADVKAAVLTAVPLGLGRLLRRVHGKALPEWAGDFDATTWAQFFLKYLIGNPAVTAVIPGTANAAHMTDNLGAAHGRVPDAAQRRRMVKLIESL